MRRRLAVLVLAAVVVAGACTAGDPSGTGPERSAPDGTVVVASFDFAESRLLAEIYAQALEARGVTVQRELDLGSRELVWPALRQGHVDLVPEYAGSALDAAEALAGSGDGRDRNDAGAAAVAARLRAVVEPWGLTVLRPAAASNENVVAVTEAFARRHDLVTVGDLAAVAPGATLGGPVECPVRPRCLVGLGETYGLDFGRFVPLAGEDLVRRALEDGVVDAGVLFATDASLASSGLVVLEDDRGLQSADNVVPVLRAPAATPEVVAVLDDVSARLRTADLRLLDWRLANAGTTEAAEARAWLVRQGLVER